MVSKPLVSVVMPVRNGAAFVLSAVNSILKQTFSDIELIVVDNGSSDQTPEIVNSIKDKRLRYFQENERGVYFALNRGIRECNGQFFARMDGDDISAATRIENQYKLWQECRAEVIGGLVTPFSAESTIGNGMGRYCDWLNNLTENGAIKSAMFIEDPIPSPTLFMPLDAIKRVGGYDVGVYPDDYNLTLKNFMAGYSFAKVGQETLLWRDHQNRLSRTEVQLSDQRFFEIKVKYFLKTVYNIKRKTVIWGLGRNAKKLYKTFKCQGVDISGFTSLPEYIVNNELYGKAVKIFSEWNGCFFIIATAAKDARETIKNELQANGLKEMVDYLSFC